MTNAFVCSFEGRFIHLTHGELFRPSAEVSSSQLIAVLFPLIPFVFIFTKFDMIGGCESSVFLFRLLVPKRRSISRRLAEHIRNTTRCGQLSTRRNSLNLNPDST